MDAQVYDDEAKFCLYWKGGAQEEKIRVTHLVSQGTIACSVPNKSNHLSQVLVLKYTLNRVKSHIATQILCKLLYRDKISEQL